MKYNDTYCTLIFIPILFHLASYIQDRQNDGNGGGCNQGSCIDRSPGDNTDVCYVDHERSQGSSHVEGGFTVFDEAAINGGEGKVTCHGFAWSTDDNDFSTRYRGNALSYVSLYDHLHMRGYVRNVPGGEQSFKPNYRFRLKEVIDIAHNVIFISFLQLPCVVRIEALKGRTF